MRKKDTLREDAGEGNLFPHKVVRNVLGKQYRIKMYLMEEEIE